MMVLIVDDEPLIAETLGIIFRKEGYTTEVVHTAEDALKFTARTRPHLVVCDIEMPVKDGLMLMEDFGREIPECPILVLTGAYRSLDKVRAQAAKLPQAVSLLTKPCEPALLLIAAGKLLQGE
jgi:CheY-like chemotaxis protein